jgi:hypothetical protein
MTDPGKKPRRTGPTRVATTRSTDP